MCWISWLIMIIGTMWYVTLRIAVSVLSKIFTWRLIGIQCYWNLTIVQLNSSFCRFYSWLSSTRKAISEILILRCALKIDLNPCGRYDFQIFWVVLDDSVTVRVGLVTYGLFDTMITRRFFPVFSPSLNDNMIGMNCSYISAECFLLCHGKLGYEDAWRAGELLCNSLSPMIWWNGRKGTFISPDLIWIIQGSRHWRMWRCFANYMVLLLSTWRQHAEI